MAAVPDTHPDRDRHDPGATPWRLGLLTLLAMVIVAGSVVLFGADDSTAEAPSTTATGITLPPLPTATSRDDEAPLFSVALFDGTTFSLAAHLANDGRPVILNLWASWCPPCREEMPDLNAASIANPGVVILGVAVSDDPIAAAAFAEEIGITYPIGIDETGRVELSYPSAGLPATFVISADGRLLTTAFGRLSPADIDALIALALAG